MNRVIVSGLIYLFVLISILLWTIYSHSQETEISIEENHPGYLKSACARIDFACYQEGARVACDRKAFVEGLLGCVDLWEQERICASTLAASGEFHGVDLEELRGQLDQAERDREWESKKGTWYLVLGVVGWIGAGVLGAMVFAR